MKTKHARQIREAILRARHRNGPDYFWLFSDANKLQMRVFDIAVFQLHCRDLRKEMDKLRKIL